MMREICPDTVKGAKTYLMGCTTIPKDIIKTATFEADPYVDGCWRATLKGYHCKYAIIYGLGSCTDNYDCELDD